MDNGDAAIFINIYWISVEQYRGEVYKWIIAQSELHMLCESEPRAYRRF